MKVIKLLVIALIFIIIFIMAGLAAAIVFVDPNDYKQPIIEQVKEHTGRDLILGGEIKLSVFPWLGLELENASLQNPAGFTDEQFIAIERIHIKAALWPLLRLQTQIGKIQLHGLLLSLEKRANGDTNWQDLISESSTESNDTTDDEATDTLANLSIGGIEIDNANITWRDATTNALTKIENFNLETSRIQIAKPISIRANFALRNKTPKLIAGIELDSEVIAEPSAEQYHLKNITAKIQASGSSIPAAEQTAKIKIASILTKLAEQTIEAQQITLSVADVEVQTDIQAQQILSDSPTFNGNINLSADSIRKTMEILTLEIPETADSKVLGSVKMSTSFSGNTNALQLNALKLSFDDTTLTGDMGIGNFDSPTITANINIDTINADRYLPPSEPENSKSATTTTESDPVIEIPEEQIRELDVTATLTIKQLQLMNAKLSNINSQAIVKNGKLTLDPLDMNLYEGSFKGSVIIDVNSQAPLYNTTLNISGLDADPFLTDLGHAEFIEGKGNLNLVLNTSGRRLSVLKRNLDGSMKFQFNDGVLKGFNVNEMIREWKAKLKQKAYEVKDSNNATPFGSLSGDAIIQKGIVNNNTFTLNSERIIANGKGTIDLNTENLDYSLEANYIEDLESADAKYLPFYVKGPFESPSFGIDWGLIAERKKAEKKQELQQKVSQEKQAKQQEIQQKLEQKKQDKKDELKQKLKDKLKLNF